MEATIESDIEEPPFAAAVDDALGGLVGALVQVDRSSAKLPAWKVEQVYQLARFADVNTVVTTSHGMRPWSQEATARRTAISEVAAALRIPERSASDLTFSKVDQKARKVRERMDAATIAERHQRSLADRETSFEPAREGMGWLHIYASAHIGLAAYNRADDMARQLAEDPNETRTLSQSRADVVSDLLLAGAVEGRPEFGIRPSVVVTVPVLAILGQNTANRQPDLPILEGYGPIDIDTATKLAGAAKSWLRVLTHPETGVTLSVGRDRYKVPAPLRAFLQRRDGTCRKPGCNRPAVRCDLDHAQEWQHGGQTAHDNLAHLCQVHHDEKHHTGVTVKHLPNGDIEWTMASGRTYVSEPANRFPGIHDLSVADLSVADLSAA